jgi:hypothetical protein
VGLSPLGTAATSGLFYKPQVIDEGDCGAISGMKIDRGNRSTRRKPAPVPLCPPQIPHDQTRARTLAAAVGNQRLTAWAMARPSRLSNSLSFWSRILFENLADDQLFRKFSSFMEFEVLLPCSHKPITVSSSDSGESNSRSIYIRYILIISSHPRTNLLISW